MSQELLQADKVLLIAVHKIPGGESMPQQVRVTMDADSFPVFTDKLAQTVRCKRPAGL
jgi:hypothetical protein